MTPPARNSAPPIRVSLAEDADAYREHLAALLNGADGFHCSGAHTTAEAAPKHVAREKPDVLLLDPRTAPHLRRRLPGDAVRGPRKHLARQR
jgi:DNA-binding NarL/FixJ family response regulator